MKEISWRAGPEAGQGLTYSAWAPGEPNNGGYGENYLNLTSGNGWNDVRNDYGLSYVVEFEAVPEPAAWALMILGFGTVGASLRRRSAAKISYAA